MSGNLPHRVQGFCRGCGRNTLILGAGNHVVCGHLECPDPTAVDRLLDSLPSGTPARIAVPYDPVANVRAAAEYVKSQYKIPEPLGTPPSVGRIVHVAAKDRKCMAAIIIRVYTEQDPPEDPELVPGVVASEWVELSGLGAAYTYLGAVCHDELTKLPQTWHWPERV